MARMKQPNEGNAQPKGESYADLVKAMLEETGKGMGIPAELLNQMSGTEPVYELIDGEMVLKGHKPTVIKNANNKYVLKIEGKELKLSEDFQALLIAEQRKNNGLLTQMDLDKLFKKFNKEAFSDVPPEDPNEIIETKDEEGETIRVPRHVANSMKGAKNALDAWWQPVGKPKLKVSEMKTGHLFNSLRLIYNKLVPAKYQMDVKDAANFTATVAVEESKHILNVMFYQIGLRDNLTDEQFEKLQTMATVVRRIL